MNLLLKNAIKQSGGDDSMYFRSCYYWKYKKHVDIHGDILAYRVQGRIPDYVIAFLRHHYEM